MQMRLCGRGRGVHFQAQLCRRTGQRAALSEPQLPHLWNEPDWWFSHDFETPTKSADLSRTMKTVHVTGRAAVTSPWVCPQGFFQP